MKNWLLAFSIAAVLATGFLLLRKDNEVAAARSRAEAAERQKHEFAAAAARQQKRATELQELLRETRDTSAARGAGRAALQQELIRSATGDSAQKNRLLRDPKIRKAMIAEAREGIEKNIKSLFKAGLAQELQLDESGSAQLAGLLTQKRALFWDKMLMPMMTGEIAEADMPAAGQAIRSAVDENKRQLRDLLGEEGLRTYEWFEKTEGARDEYKQLDAKFVKAGQQLTEQQQTQLYAILTDEHANFKMHYDFEDPAQLDLDHWYNNFSEDKLDVCGQDVEALNERMLQRAQALLSADQLDIFRELLAQRSLKARFVVMTTSAMLARQR